MIKLRLRNGRRDILIKEEQRETNREGSNSAQKNVKPVFYI